MSVESASYISGLNVLWPLDSDAKSEGDNHLRVIKSALKDSFPNINGPVTVSQTELNHLSGVASNVQTQINDWSATISSMTTRINSLSSTLTTLSQSISALNTLATSRPVYGMAAYMTASQNILTAGSATILFGGKYYDVGSTFDTATGRVTAPSGSRFGRFRFEVYGTCATGVGAVSVKLARDGSAIAGMMYSAFSEPSVVGEPNYMQFSFKSPFITASSGDTFCIIGVNTTSGTFACANTTYSTSTFEAEFITWS